jgi:hypothetical protein
MAPPPSNNPLIGTVRSAPPSATTKLLGELLDGSKTQKKRKLNRPSAGVAKKPKQANVAEHWTKLQARLGSSVASKKINNDVFDMKSLKDAPTFRPSTMPLVSLKKMKNPTSKNRRGTKPLPQHEKENNTSSFRSDSRIPSRATTNKSACTSLLAAPIREKDESIAKTVELPSSSLSVSAVGARSKKATAKFPEQPTATRETISTAGKGPSSSIESSTASATGSLTSSLVTATRFRIHNNNNRPTAAKESTTEQATSCTASRGNEATISSGSLALNLTTKTRRRAQNRPVEENRAMTVKIPSSGDGVSLGGGGGGGGATTESLMTTTRRPTVTCPISAPVPTKSAEQVLPPPTTAANRSSSEKVAGCVKVPLSQPPRAAWQAIPRPEPQKDTEAPSSNNNYVRLNLRNAAGACRGARNKKGKRKAVLLREQRYEEMKQQRKDSKPFPSTRGSSHEISRHSGGVDPLDDFLDGVFHQPSKNKKQGNTDAIPKCPGHQRPCKLLTVKKNTRGNKGRQFYACQLPRGEQCDFFQWAEDTVQVGQCVRAR